MKGSDYIMAVIYDCMYCGKGISSDMNFEGNAVDFQKWFLDKVKQLSDKCECRKEGTSCRHLHTESTHPYGWIACKDCGKLIH